jgi:flagellin-like hook-associated protein FlgL
MTSINTKNSVSTEHYELLKNQQALQSPMENLSLVSDQDYSATTKEMARTQIIQQAATAMLVQANQQPSTVMFLLR